MRMRPLVAMATAALLLTTPIVAQSPFHWHAGDDSKRWSRVEQADRLERTADRVASRVSRIANRVADRVKRAVDRVTRRVERRSHHLSDRIHARIDAHMRSIVDAHIDASAWAFSFEQGAFDSDPCSNFGRRDRDDYYTHCEVRDEKLPAGALTVDARPNGGIHIEAWDRNEIRVRAIVQAHARTLDAARQLAGRVQVQAGSGRVSASGPDESERGRREWWSVSYRINVPRQTDLELNSVNGGISIAGVSGTQRFETHNGGVTLADLGGSVRGETHNGGLKVSLGGTRWEGEGLDVETSNGGVTLAIPETYNAQLDTRTVNGGVRFDYPMTIVGELTARHGISTTLGSGGPPVRVRTTNGGLRIERR